MSWLAFVFALEVGLLPNNAWMVYEPPAVVVNEVEFYQQLEIRAVVLDHLFVGGKVRVYDWVVERELNFWPSGAAFLFEAGLEFGWLELGLRHWCGVHPITPYLERVPERVAAEGGYDELYLRIEIGVGRGRRR